MVRCAARAFAALAGLCTAARAATEGEVDRGEVDAHDAFLAWLDREAFPKHNLSLALFESPEMPGTFYRGIKSNVGVRHGEKILSIPKRYFLHKGRVWGTPLGDALKPLNDDLPPRVFLACYLLVESARPDSYWAPYFRVMPQSHATLLYFTEEEMAELQCASEEACPVLARVRRMREELRQAYAKVEPVLREHAPAGAEVTYERFQWAYVSVASRAFSLNVTDSYGTTLVGRGAEGLGHTPILIPFADMLNHHNSVPALQFSYEYDDGSEQIHVYADQDYAAGDQVFISYGILPNPDLLVTYGFVMTDNAYETVGVSLGLERTDPLLEAKRALLRERQLTRFTDTHVGLDGEPSSQFLEAMRVREYVPARRPLEEAPSLPPRPPAFGRGGAPPPPPPEDAAAAEHEEAVLREAAEAMAATDFSVPVDGDNEFSVHNALLMNYEALLRGYPTTMWEDAALVRSGRLPRRKAMATLLRAEVKRVLHAAALEALHSVRRAYEMQERERYAKWAAHIRDERRLGGEAAQRADRLSRLYESMRGHWQEGNARWDAQWRQWRDAVDGLWGRTNAREERARTFDPAAITRAQETIGMAARGGGGGGGGGAAKGGPPRGLLDVDLGVRRDELARAVEETVQRVLQESGLDEGGRGSAEVDPSGEVRLGDALRFQDIMAAAKTMGGGSTAAPPDPQRRGDGEEGGGAKQE